MSPLEALPLNHESVFQGRCPLPRASERITVVHKPTLDPLSPQHQGLKQLLSGHKVSPCQGEKETLAF